MWQLGLQVNRLLAVPMAYGCPSDPAPLALLPPLPFRYVRMP